MKMKLVCFAVVLFCLGLTGAKIYNNGAPYVTLIKWIRDYYTSSAVFLLHPHQPDQHFDGLKITHLSYMWSRLLGREQVATLSGSIDNIYTYAKYHNTLRPLIIVFIPGPNAMFELSNYTQSLKMSSFAWFVLFLPTMTNAESNYCYEPVGNPFHLLFDTEMLVMCHGDPVLREWYSVDGNSTETFDLIKWQPEKQLNSSIAAVDVLTNLSLYERRNDLRGKVLRAVTVKNSMLISVRDDKLIGYFSRAVSELENTLNFTLRVVAEEAEYGSFNTTTRRWSGAFRLVAAGEVDIGLADFSMTNVRMDYVDYMIPIVTTRNCLYMREPESFAVKWFAYYKTFSFALWMSTIVIVIMAQTVLAFIRSRIESCSIARAMWDETLQVWGIICQQGVAEFPRNSPLRLAYFTMLVTAIVISAAYSASLISFVTARIRDLSFYTIDEFLKDGGYSVIVIRGSSDYDMFAYSKDSLSMTMFKSLKPYHALPVDAQSAFENICRDNKLAFYTDYGQGSQKTSSGVRIPCKVSCLDIGRVDSLSLILSKKNQYTDVLNYYLQKLLNTGLLKRFKSDADFTEQPKFRPVAFSSVASVLIIFSCGAALAIAILLAEICCSTLRNDRVDDRVYN